MSDETPILNLPLILPAQAQKHVTHNESLRLLDITVQLAVLDRDLSTPPALPQEGDRYIIGPAPTGAWEGRSGQIAAFWGGVWLFIPPGDGWHARVLDESLTLCHQSGQWVQAAPPPETLPRLGIASTPDSGNRLTVSSPATLFSHDGAGHQLKLNKAAPADTASLLFQTDFAGRAEMGLTGSDAFSVRVSANGTTFTTALSANPATGTLAAPEGISAPLLLRDGTDPTRRATLDVSSISAGMQRNLTLPNISSELAALGGTQTFSGNKTFSGTFTVSAPTATIASSTQNTTCTIAGGATVATASKTLTLGGGGVAGSTTTIAIGPTQPGANGTLTLNGGTVTLGATVTDFDMGSASARATAIGIGGATGDGTNRLSVNSPGILFNHSGSGVETAINKANPAASGQISFKTAFSTRAQLGLLGNDDLTLRTSSDGATFATVLSVESATARASFAQPVILQGLAADPSNPPDGTLWHNAATGQLSARLGGATLRLDGQQDIAWLTPPQGELVATTTGAGGATTGTLAGAAGRIDLFPFLARADISIDRAVLNCTTAVAGALGRIALYAADSTGRPSTLITETADIDLSATGARLVTLTHSFRQGRTFWLGLRHSSTATVSTWPTTATPDLNGGTTPSTALRKVLRRTVAWGTPLPATWGFTSAEITAAAAPAIWLRMA